MSESELKLPEVFDLAFDPLTSEDSAIRNLFSDHIGATLFCALRAGRLVDDHFNPTVVRLADECRALQNESLLNLANVLRALRRSGNGIFGQSEDMNDAATKIFALLNGRTPLKIKTPTGRFLTQRRIELDGVLDVKKRKCPTDSCPPILVGGTRIDDPPSGANIANIENLLEKLNGRHVRVIVEFESGQSEPVELIDDRR